MSGRSSARGLNVVADLQAGSPQAEEIATILYSRIYWWIGIFVRWKLFCNDMELVFVSFVFFLCLGLIPCFITFAIILLRYGNFGGRRFLLKGCPVLDLIIFEACCRILAGF